MSKRRSAVMSTRRMEMNLCHANRASRPLTLDAVLGESFSERASNIAVHLSTDMRTFHSCDLWRYDQCGEGDTARSCELVIDSEKRDQRNPIDE